MKNNLDHVEAHLRHLFEESLLKIFSGGFSPTNLIDDFMEAMQQGLQETAEGMILAPDRYYLTVHSDDLIEWQTHQDTLDEMAEKIGELGKEAGFSFISAPLIVILSDPAHLLDKVKITTEISTPEESLPDTAAMDQPDDLSSEVTIPANASLVIGGKTNFPLEKAVVNIGRHSDNDLVIDDQYTSRHHAQLRVINKRYVIFDVGSTGGIVLNNKLISKAALQPGDVIRIGMVNLIYIQDSTAAHPTTAVPIDCDKDIGEGRA